MYGNELIEKLDNLIGKNIQLYTGVARIRGVLKNRQQKADKYIAYDVNENIIIIDSQRLYSMVLINYLGAETVISIYR